SRPRRCRALELRVNLLARQPARLELVRKLVGEDDERLLAGAQRAVALGRRPLSVAEGKLALEDERVGSSVDDHQIVGDLVEPWRRQAVVEAWNELDLDGDLALGAAGDPNQLVIGMGSVRVLAGLGDTVGEEIGEDERPRRRLEGGLEDVRSGQIAPRRLVVVVEGRDAEEPRLRPVEDPGEHRTRLEAMEGAPVDRAVLRDERARVAVRQKGVVGDRRVDRNFSHDTAFAPLSATSTKTLIASRSSVSARIMSS